MHPNFNAKESTMESTVEKDSRLDILSYASIFEDDFSIDWVIEITGKKALVILSALEYGCEKLWLKTLDTGIFRFTDPDKLSDIRALLPQDKTRDLHSKAFEILASELPDLPGKNHRLTAHLLKIQNQLPGCRLLLKEGNEQRKACQIDGAKKYYDKALEDLEHLSGKPADALFMATALEYAKIWTTTQS